jgi:hypothetical protein
MLGHFQKAIAGIALVQAALFGLLTPSAASAQSLFPEVQVGTRDIVDFEFDWGRDGIQCPTCNYGAGNSRLAYIDDNGSLWVGYVDYHTGFFFPANGQAVLIDDRGVTAESIGNGPEWMISQRGSELVYSRWADKRPRTFNNLTIGHAYITGGSWIGESVPDTRGFVLPVGSLDLEDPVPLLHYQNFSKRKTDVYWRPATKDATPTRLELGSSDPGVTRRWVPGTNKIILTYEIPPAEGSQAEQAVFRQVYLYSPSDGSMEQLTFEPQSKYWAFMWQAPEYNNDYLFFVMVGSKELHVYRRVNQGGGVWAWTVINKILMPAETPFITSPEPFVHNGKSWIFFTVSAKRDGHSIRSASHVAMTGIVPGASTVRLLTSDESVQHVRRDPEYFITANGPYLYYNRFAITGSGDVVHEGVFRIDTGLGPAEPQEARLGLPTLAK